MKYLLPILIIHFAFFANAQTSHQSVEDQHEKFKMFIPKGYYILSLTEGDLNLDPWNDAILILGQNGEDSLSGFDNQMKRKCLLLTGNEKNTYNLACQNDNMIYYYKYDLNFPESLVDINLKKGIFTFSFYGGMRTRWHREISFHYSTEKKLWYLISDISGTFDALEEDKSLETEKNLFEKDFGFVNFTAFNVYE